MNFILLFDKVYYYNDYYLTFFFFLLELEINFIQ